MRTHRIAWLGCLRWTLLLLPLLLTGCASWKTLDPPVADAVSDHEGQRLRVKPKDRGPFVYVGARVESDSIVGDTEALERYAIAIEDVDYVQVRGTENVGTGLVILGVMGAVVALAVIFASTAGPAAGLGAP